MINESTIARMAGNIAGALEVAHGHVWTYPVIARNSVELARLIAAEVEATAPDKA